MTCKEAIARFRELESVRFVIIVAEDFGDADLETARRLLAEAPWGERVEIRRSRLAGVPEPGAAFVLRLPEMIDMPYPIPPRPAIDVDLLPPASPFRTAT